MPVFFNPFMKHDVSDFPDVYVPLDQAQRHPSVVAAQHEKLGADEMPPPDYKDAEAGSKPDSHYGATTLESLRAEIDSGMLTMGTQVIGEDSRLT